MKGQGWREDYTANSIPGSSCRCLENVCTAVNGTIMKYIRGRRTLDRQKMDIPSVFFVYKTLVMSLKIEVW